MNAVKFPFEFDVKRIASELEKISDGFEPIFSLHIKDFDLMGTHLIIPNPKEGELSYLETDELKKSPYLKEVLDSFPSDKLIYRVHKLIAGGKINLHHDAGRGLKNGIVRIHIPLTSNDQNFFYVDDERVQMKNGECWWANITKPHHVENRSNTDRLQLMIDCEMNDWWEERLREEGIELKADQQYEGHSLQTLKAIRSTLIALNTDSRTLEELEASIKEREKGN